MILEECELCHAMSLSVCVPVKLTGTLILVTDIILG